MPELNKLNIARSLLSIVDWLSVTLPDAHQLVCLLCYHGNELRGK